MGKIRYLGTVPTVDRYLSHVSVATDSSLEKIKF